ncbi:similar to Saccharomyces cerevisiae YIL056W VHR1 Transcriptional activator [Maudiozyma barnettii]|uniref:Similar to Saccharomyces cerevisiae YIL056W VHR1 Transcriptional activator n=1 Tax=Maudiozyma barnettii TaxID=61262 RepID=A0A8H2ZFD8_9SACH|nr:uncharacterized protein KABA2_01S09394 [Kazachstania barnettii]CAB4252250.1 similar to Saccharomyces cerevisiae YIL056W VHR1 Transcriptional activator [Kazachstania barnettii]CAD1778919.1 similar to Saccharomyces cerevisiae YIL056W VHR1 Transcriptional activator [Kazachstania barnettii]
MDYSRVTNTTGRSSAFMKYRLNKYTASSSGTTHKIREALNFKDEMKWKRFSNRRLELIDKFKLSKFKASEQDQNIKQIANILRTEFEYPESTLGEFEKLVTAAVQSVRRNRKRSMKRRAAAAAASASMANNSMNGAHMMPSFMTANGTPTTLRSSMNFHNSDHSINYGNYSQGAIPNTFVQAPMGYSQPLPQYVADPIYQTPNMQPNVFIYQNVPGSRSISGSNVTPTLPVMPQNNDHLSYQWMNNNNQQYNAMSLPMNVNMPVQHNSMDLIMKSSLPQTSQSQQELNYDTTLKGLISNLISNVNNGKLNRSAIPAHLRDSLINGVRHSKTCFEISQSASPIKSFEDLKLSGEMAVRDSVSFVIQNYFHQLITSSLDFATAKVCSPRTLSALAVELFDSSVRYNMSQLPMVEIQIELLYLVLGAIIKDFGYDPNYLPLADIIHEKLREDYPQDANLKLVNNKPVELPMMDTLVVKEAPKRLSEEFHFKKININYKGQKQFFIFKSSDKKSITIMDILENCRAKFDIDEEEVNNLAIYYNKDLIVNDMKLSNIFVALSDTDEFSIEIKSLNISDDTKVPRYIQSPISAKLNMATPVLNIHEKSSVDDLNITLPPMVVNKFNQNSFGNGTLPRPMLPVTK